MEFVIITGLSGSGKSTVVDVLEDIGFFCVDNVPPQLIPKFSQIFEQVQTGSEAAKISKAAFVTDIRGGEMLLSLNGIIGELKESGVEVKVIFLNASDEVIKRRYKETRRRHPLFVSENGNMDKALRAERDMLAPIAAIADYTVDTTGMVSVAALKEAVLGIFFERISDSMQVKCVSFGFKYGIPWDADMVFDVRFLPNPFYVPELKTKTGLDEPVRDFVMKSDVSKDMERRLLDLLTFLIPQYVSEGKSQLVIAFGCTGGKHRSVTFAELVCGHLKSSEYKVTAFHRDIGKK